MWFSSYFLKIIGGLSLSVSGFNREIPLCTTANCISTNQQWKSTLYITFN
jgi:hypothetical protein